MSKQQLEPSEAIAMKDAKTLLLEFLAAVTHGQNAAALFAEDGAVELPFLHSLGIPWRHRGRRAIRQLQDNLAGLYLDFAFKPEDTHILIDTPEQVFADTATAHQYAARPVECRSDSGQNLGAPAQGARRATMGRRVFRDAAGTRLFC